MYVSLWLLFLFNHRIETFFSKPTPITDRCLDSPCSVFPTEKRILGRPGGWTRSWSAGSLLVWWYPSLPLWTSGLTGVRLYGSLNLVMLLHW